MTSQPAAHPTCNEVNASKIKSLCGQYVDLMCTKIAFLGTLANFRGIM